jgi:hypothetical protein
MADIATKIPLATTTLSSSQSSVTFSSINGSYTDLVLVVSPISSSGSSAVRFQINSDTGTNYSSTVLYGTGSSAGSSRNTNVTYARTHEYAGFNTVAGGTTLIVNLNNYSNTTTYKNWMARSNQASDGVDALVGLWRNTSAITSLYIFPSAANFASGSTFTLYGIL